MKLWVVCSDFTINIYYTHATNFIRTFRKARILAIGWHCVTMGDFFGVDGIDISEEDGQVAVVSG